MESRVSISLKRSTSETWSVCERASVRTMKSKSAAVNRARQFALIIGNAFCGTGVSMASQIDIETKRGKWDRCSLATAAVVRDSRIHEHRFTRIAHANGLPR